MALLSTVQLVQSGTMRGDRSPYVRNRPPIRSASRRPERAFPLVARRNSDHRPDPVGSGNGQCAPVESSTHSCHTGTLDSCRSSPSKVRRLRRGQISSFVILVGTAASANHFPFRPPASPIARKPSSRTNIHLWLLPLLCQRAFRRYGRFHTHPPPNDPEKLPACPALTYRLYWHTGLNFVKEQA